MALIWHQSPLARLQRIYESCRPQLVAAARADAPGDEALHALPDPAPTPAETAEGRDAAAVLRPQAIARLHRSRRLRGAAGDGGRGGVAAD